MTKDGLDALYKLFYASNVIVWAFAFGAFAYLFIVPLIEGKPNMQAGPDLRFSNPTDQSYKLEITIEPGQSITVPYPMHANVILEIEQSDEAGP